MYIELYSGVILSPFFTLAIIFLIDYIIGMHAYHIADLFETGLKTITSIFLKIASSCYPVLSDNFILL